MTSVSGSPMAEPEAPVNQNDWSASSPLTPSDALQFGSTTWKSPPLSLMACPSVSKRGFESVVFFVYFFLVAGVTPDTTIDPPLITAYASREMPPPSSSQPTEAPPPRVATT